MPLRRFSCFGDLHRCTQQTISNQRQPRGGPSQGIRSLPDRCGAEYLRSLARRERPHVHCDADVESVTGSESSPTRLEE